MQAENQESWNLIVSAKSKNFNLKLKATKISPTCKFLQFSIFLKIQQFVLRLKSDSAVSSPIPRQRRSLKSRFLAAAENFRRGRRKKQPVTARETPKLTNPGVKMKSPMNRLLHLGLGILVFLFQSIYETDKGVVLVGSVVLLYFLTSTKMKTNGKSKTMLAFSVISVAAAVSLVMFGLKKFVNYYLSLILHSLFGSHGNV